MPSKKKTAKISTTVEGVPSSTESSKKINPNMPLIPETVPMASYISLVGVHTSLWVFVALYLPRTTLLVELTRTRWDDSHSTSRDRPQHPFLEALTANSVSTLISICAGAALLQPMYAGWLREWWLNLGIRGAIEERQAEKALHRRQKLFGFRNAWMATFTASFVIHLLLVLFGAPIASLKLKTYLLALLISIMIIYPPAYVLGVPTLGSDSGSVVKYWTWVRLFAEFSLRNPVERALVYPVIGSIVGCWVGIIPIALDWDRPWQAWPLPPAFGAILGYIVTSIAALTASSLIQLAQEQSRRQGAATDEKTK